MKIGLIDVDGHNGHPNLALMRLSAYHKAQGDEVDWWNGFEEYDRVYMSKVFTFSPDMDTVIRAKEIIRGGTGYKDYRNLPSEVEATFPDYSIYPNFKAAIGFLTRGCIRNCPWCIVPRKEGHIRAAAHIVKFKGQELGQHPTSPLNTITAQGLEYAECRAVLAKVQPGQDLGYWPKVRALLNEHCGYNLADDEIILLIIRGVAYFIFDITLRMLVPRELYSAMSFPEDYIIEVDFMGNVYPKKKQVERCGNAVCCVLAEAVVRANFPEWCSVTIVNMAQFHKAVAV